MADLSALAAQFRLLGDPNRMQIVAQLRHGPQAVGDLAAAVGLSASLVSHHLAALRAAGLVRMARDPQDARRVQYGLDAPGLARLRGAWDTALSPPPAAPPASETPRMALLRRLPFLAELPTADLAILARHLIERRVTVGETLFWEGEDCPGIFLIASGSARIVKAAPGGHEQVLRVMGPGDSFNEVPVFDRGPNPASARVVEGGVFYLLPADAVRALLATSPAFANAVVRLLAERLRHLVALVEDLGFRPVLGRVAKILLQTVRPESGVGAGAGRRQLTQQEIADMAGTAREVVARALHALEQAGAIRVERGRIVLTDPARLEQLL